MSLDRDDLQALLGSVLHGRQAGFHYRLERVLGEGNQAVVLLAARVGPSGEDPVAIKVFRPSFVLARPEVAELVLHKESVALARLNERVPPSPHVVRMLDAGDLTHGGATVPWLALEYVHGGALGSDLGKRVIQSLRDGGTSLGPERAWRLLRGVVLGLVALHEIGVVHRDLRPSSVLVCGAGPDEMTKVAGFGLARHTGMKATFGEDASLGAVGFAAPEQRSDERIGPWSDVFSLAALTYYMLGGRPMFPGAAPIALSNTFLGRFEPLASCPALDPAWSSDGGALLGAIDDVLRRATRRIPQDRTPSPQAFWSEIEPLLRGAIPARARAAKPDKRTLESAAHDPWTFEVRHRPAEAFGFSAAAFDPDGHGLCASPLGLWFWEGSRFLPLASVHGVSPAAIRVLVRLDPSRWLAAGDDGHATLFSPARCDAQKPLGDFRATAAAACSEAEVAVAGVDRAGSAVVHTFCGGRWMAPLALPGAVIGSVAKGKDGAYWMAGKDASGRGRLWALRPGEGSAYVATAPSRLTAVAGDGGDQAYAVAEDGSILRASLRETVIERAFGPASPLTHVAVDPAGVAWAAGPGRILRRHASGGSVGWSVAWSDPESVSPFVGFAAFSGMIVAATLDGAVVMGHQRL